MPTDDQRDKRAAETEKLYKKYDRLAQPRITDVQANVDIYPDKRWVDIHGTYTLVNKTAQPIRDLHVIMPPTVSAFSVPIPGATLAKNDRPITATRSTASISLSRPAQRSRCRSRSRFTIADSRTSAATTRSSPTAPSSTTSPSSRTSATRRGRNCRMRTSAASTASRRSSAWRRSTIPKRAWTTASPATPTGSISIRPSARRRTRSRSRPATCRRSGPPTAAATSTTRRPRRSSDSGRISRRATK